MPEQRSRLGRRIICRRLRPRWRARALADGQQAPDDNRIRQRHPAGPRSSDDLGPPPRGAASMPWPWHPARPGPRIIALDISRRGAIGRSAACGSSPSARSRGARPAPRSGPGGPFARRRAPSARSARLTGWVLCGTLWPGGEPVILVPDRPAPHSRVKAASGAGRDWCRRARHGGGSLCSEPCRGRVILGRVINSGRHLLLECFRCEAFQQAPRNR